MKNILRMLIVVNLLIFSLTGASGAVHPIGDRIVTDTWYTITPDNPYWQIFDSSFPDLPTNTAGGEFYRNDQTFLWFQTSGTPGLTQSELSGSYLFDSGFFIGVDYLDSSTNHMTLVSPGYRFQLDENSYLALSLDYDSSSGANYVAGYEMDFCYYADKAKLTGQIYSPRAGDASLGVGAAFAVSKALVFGVDYANLDRTVSAGFTYTGDPVVIDFTYLIANSNNSSYYKLSGMFNLGEHYGLGMTVQKYQNVSDPRYTLKFKYAVNKTNIKFFYIPKGTSWDLNYGIACYTAF